MGEGNIDEGNVETIFSQIKPYLQAETSLVLDSCNAGREIAKKISEVTEKKVFACSDYSWEDYIHITNLNPLEVKFYVPKRIHISSKLDFMFKKLPNSPRFPWSTDKTALFDPQNSEINEVYS